MHAITKVHSHLGRSILVECTKIEQITSCLKSKLYICMVLGPCVIIKDDMQLLQLTKYYSSAASLSELVFLSEFPSKDSYSPLMLLYYRDRGRCNLDKSLKTSGD